MQNENGINKLMKTVVQMLLLATEYFYSCQIVNNVTGLQ
jgi:hypothetical protein